MRYNCNMQEAAINFSQFALADGDDCQRRIADARRRLGARVCLLAHHYQRADVYCHADLTGDSLKLSRLAADSDAELIVFCGVHFMAEVADILTDSGQKVLLPDLAAGCSMADMASLSKVERAWRELAQVLDPDEEITPVTYINSAADLKAFCAAAWRDCLHLQQCCGDFGMVLCEARQGAVFSRPASGAVDGADNGNVARRYGGVGF